MIKEIFKNEVFKKVVIPGYCDGEYEISNYGRLWSVRENMFKSPSSGSYGHLQFVLSVNNVQISRGVHVLVANAFIPNPENKTVVHHRDGVPTTNFVENLMWVTPQEHALIHKSWEYANKFTEKPVYKYSLDGEYVEEYSSASEAARQMNGSQGNISSCCVGRGSSKTVYGFQWSYEKHDRIAPIETFDKRRWKNRAKPVCQYSTDGTFIAEYVSAAEAGRITNIESSNIRNCCRGREDYKRAGGFIWKYKDAV